MPVIGNSSIRLVGAIQRFECAGVRPLLYSTRTACEKLIDAPPGYTPLFIGTPTAVLASNVQNRGYASLDVLLADEDLCMFRSCRLAPRFLVPDDFTEARWRYIQGKRFDLTNGVITESDEKILYKIETGAGFRVNSHEDMEDPANVERWLRELVP